MEKKINWGIIGLGNIAHTFASDLQLSEKGRLFGVASRDLAKARAFSEKYQAVACYDSYEALARDPNVDVVYVATPHTFHYQNTMNCLQRGKAVLCEKPMGITRAEVENMFREAESRYLFLMEGMWTRFIPATEKLLELLGEGTIGELQMIRADFGFRADPDPAGRLFNKKLGGGSLLDIGIYPVYLSLLTLGLPASIKAMARMGPTGVDTYCAMLLDYDSDAKAVLESTVESDTPIEAWLYGSLGSIRLHSRFHHTEKITLHLHTGSVQTLDLKYKGNGYIHEIEEVHECLAAGRIESPRLPARMSLDLIKVIDRVKEEIGLDY